MAERTKSVELFVSRRLPPCESKARCTPTLRFPRGLDCPNALRALSKQLPGTPSPLAVLMRVVVHCFAVSPPRKRSPPPGGG